MQGWRSVESIPNHKDPVHNSIMKVYKIVIVQGSCMIDSLRIIQQVQCGRLTNSTISRNSNHWQNNIRFHSGPARPRWTARNTMGTSGTEGWDMISLGGAGFLHIEGLKCSFGSLALPWCVHNCLHPSSRPALAVEQEYELYAVEDHGGLE